MPKPTNNRNNMTGSIWTRFVKRGSMTKKKEKPKKMERESSQQTITEAEKQEELDKETKRREKEEGRLRWLQEQRIKYPVAPDGYIPNSIVRRNLRPHVPHPPDTQPDDKTKPHQLSLLERRMSRLERMNSVGMLQSSESRLAYCAASAASRQASASSTLSATDRERPSSKKKDDRADVVNDVITQMRQTSPQLTSFLELEDRAEVEPRFEKSTTSLTSEDAEGSAREAEKGRGRGGELVDEEAAQEDSRREMIVVSGSEVLRGSGKDVDPTDPLHASRPHQEEDSSQHHNDGYSSAFSSSVAKQPATNGSEDQTSAKVHPKQEKKEDIDSTDRMETSPERDEEDALKDDATISASTALAAADDVREDAQEGKEEEATAAKRDVVGSPEGEGSDDHSRPSKLRIPRIFEPVEGADDDGTTSDAEQGTRSEASKEAQDKLVDDNGVVAEHDGKEAEFSDVTGSRPHGAPSGGGKQERNEPSSRVGIEEDLAGQSDESQGFDSKEEMIKVVLDIKFPKSRENQSSSDSDEAEKAADLDGDLRLNRVTEEEPEVDEDEYGTERRKADRGVNGAEWGDGDEISSSFSSSCALRLPCNHDDDLDLTSFNSLRAATNTSLPIFSDLDESQNRGKGDESANFLNFIQARNLNEFSYETEENKDGRGNETRKETEEEQEEDENCRCWSSCSNGRLNRRYNREAMEEGSIPSPPLGWHLPWYDRYYRNTGSSKADRRDVADSEAGGGFLPQLLSKKEKQTRRHHRCEYSILVQRRMHEHISITRYLRTKRLTEVLCDLGRPINANIIKFQYSA